MKEVKILAPCAMLGYGYSLDSFEEGMMHKPDAIVVDAGSTDGGPHKLGAGVAIVSRRAYAKDLIPLLKHGLAAGIPVIIGSAGGSGGAVHVQWTLDVINEILLAENIKNVKTAIIWADIPHEAVRAGLKNGIVKPLGNNIPELTEQRLTDTTAIVAQMGYEPILAALKEGVQLIVSGRAYDPAPFAAVSSFYGIDLALGYHLGKILECAALCADPGSAKDCMLGTFKDDGFILTPLGGKRKCTPLSVAAHTFYEKDHPYTLHGPGHVLDLENCEFKQIDDRSVFVRGSRIKMTDPYRIKLEGARLETYRSFVLAGIRDPMLIECLEEVQEDAKKQTLAFYGNPEGVSIRFINYGKNGVLGKQEPSKNIPHEIGVVLDVLASDQETAKAVCATLRSTLLHYGYQGRKSTAGNLAFPFAPSDVSFGPVYEFSVYHLMDVSTPEQYFPIEWQVMNP